MKLRKKVAEAAELQQKAEHEREQTEMKVLEVSPIHQMLIDKVSVIAFSFVKKLQQNLKKLIERIEGKVNWRKTWK